MTVSQNEGLSQTDLVRLTGIDRSTLADMISRMIKNRLLGRRRTKDDARANSVHLTTKGRAALNKVLPKVAAAEKKILSAVPTKHRAAFLAALAAIAEATSEGEAAPARKAVKKTTKRKVTKKKAKRKAAKKSTKRKAKKATKKKAKRKAAKKRRVARKASKKAVKRSSKKAVKRKAAKKKTAKRKVKRKAKRKTKRKAAKRKADHVRKR